MMLTYFIPALLALASGASAALNVTGSTCTVTPLPVEGGKEPDDTQQILDAFKQCGKNGKVILTEGSFHIGKVMDLKDLSNVDIEIHGTLRWSSDIQYWLGNSIGVEYAQRSTAWRIGGQDISIRGFGKALFDGQGQFWYDQNRGGSNQAGRPISLTLWHAKNVFIDGITWRQSQFWHTFVAYSENITMTNLDMNSTSNSQWSTVNTDGTDTWNSKDVFIKNWTVTCGDDCIAIKGNSTNIQVSDVHCYESGCATIGSLGNNPGNAPDFVQDVTFDNITCTHSSNAAWVKTYSGNGLVRNVTFSNIRAENVNQPIYVTSCIYTARGCDQSRLPIQDVRWINVTGTSRYNIASAIHCSASSPCSGFSFENVEITPLDGKSTPKYLCSNIQGQTESGIPCTGTCPADWPQQLSGNR
ncbi:glycoside hydrolase family 28 protein [Daldinia loculata]|uniref:glycoside hydrolase family 28 protein n=1 Tax=Daldinia loculata TaxID=103429 RepID=UPI0020C4BB97|nr:glycoside hydrolase family 28 protein [Daldinia loculata]KAI1651685.1 glycoside hydrolase family 28 protein [Daldinia loculata]